MGTVILKEPIHVIRDKFSVQTPPSFNSSCTTSYMMRFINLIVPLVLEFLIGVSASLHKPNCPNNDIIWEVESSTGTATLICTGCRQTGESFKLAPCPKSNCGGYWLPKRNCPKCGIDPPPRRKFYDK
ncbi:uncharacterized protein PGTG_16479 [Puccinia graminis f. sp. tritici CRL 75-36-700-3]|uniref:Uncharacterized protein n=1 Tax=Puccinia graminis f. sp. tritici (strain CRL 75-36-700-3 / race SCCL) TaxID=418459 RepID=E3L0X6_PUCGT|nr:uncharacterized protein PGTG_16479 [Puccinia graminis f. sp. tritici CRL 75-36-700-3]EFP90201.1 hypothetical protein PGTG_16479 [Puccinia graminis f. sp. tritici CRL 75-36-700-3]